MNILRILLVVVGLAVTVFVILPFALWLYTYVMTEAYWKARLKIFKDQFKDNKHEQEKKTKQVWR